MILLCTIQVIAMSFVSTVTIEGRRVSENTTKYLVDFSAALKKNDWVLVEGGEGGRMLVPKDACVKVRDK